MPLPDTRPKILLVTRNFPPLQGGMERLMQHMAQGLSRRAELTIIGPLGCSQHAPQGAIVYETSPRLLPFVLLSLYLGFRACMRRKYDFILGGSGLAAPALYLLRLLFGAKTALFVHGLDLVVQSKGYQIGFIPCIRKMDSVIANSVNTQRIALEKGVPKENIFVVNPGTTLPELSELKSRKDVLLRHQIPFENFMIFVGRISERKGLSRFIEYSMPDILAAEPGSGLLVIGDNPDQALTNCGEHKKVLELVARMSMEGQVMFLGQISDNELQACFAAADVHVFPIISIPGDVEGFGMVAIEAAACGTPTVAFDVGGVGDAISDLNGKLIEPGNYDLFTDAVISSIRPDKEGTQSCISHAKQYSWNAYDERIKKIIC